MDRQLSTGYAAGLIDGEGWVGLRASNGPSRRFEVRVEVQMNAPAVPLHLLHEQYRGSLHRFSTRERVTSPTVRWSLGKHTDLSPFLAAIASEVLIKKRQVGLAQEVIDAIRRAPKAPNGQTIWTPQLSDFALKAAAEMGRLNARGIDALADLAEPWIAEFDPHPDQLVLLA